MTETHVLYVLIAVFLLQSVERASTVMLANWYDLRHVDSKGLGEIKLRRKPSVTVIVLARNDENTIQACLDSIRVNRYSKIEVICVDNKSADKTRQEVRRYSKTHKKLKVRLISKRKVTNRKDAYQDALRRSSGKVILLMNADNLLYENTIEKAVSNFEASSRAAIPVVKLPQVIVPYPSIFALYERFLYLIKHQKQKSRLVIGAYRVDLYAHGMVYAKSYLAKLKKQPAIVNAKELLSTGGKQGNVSFVYDSRNPIAMMPSVSLQDLLKKRHATFGNYEGSMSGKRRTVSIWREVFRDTMVLLEPIMLTYFFYLAYSFKNSTLFVLTLISLVLWLLLVIVSNENIRFLEKFRLIFAIPAMYVLFFIASVANAVRVVARGTVYVKLFSQKLFSNKSAVRHKPAFAKRHESVNP